MNLTAVSLFSGIEGFGLALEANGIKLLCQVEIDERCTSFLERAWPGIPKYKDIKEFPAELYRGADFVVGGPPCQPISCAGKRRGKKDDRWLWEETLAVVETIRPSWCLFENPAAIRTMGLDGILSTLESLGYTTGTVGIPACAVGAPHIRNRYWIVAHTYEPRCEGPDVREGREPEDGLCAEYREGDVADTGSTGSYNPTNPSQAEQDGNRQDRGIYFGSDRVCEQWFNAVWVPCADGKFRRAPDNSFGLVDGLHRSVLAALGNSIVPQVAYQIIKAMIETEGVNQSNCEATA